MQDNVCSDEVYSSIFRTYAESLRNFLYYKTGNLQRSEDLVQDAFSKLWEQCSKVSSDKAKSFLYTVANNMFLNEVKHQKVIYNFIKKAHPNQSIETPQYLMEESEFKARLEAGIQELPPGQREVFLMNRIEKLKYREIADRLGLSVKAVEKRMHKALVSLRKISPKL